MEANDVRTSLNRAEDWIRNHLPYFLKSKKLFLEYQQMKLYDDHIDMAATEALLNFYTDEYGSLDRLLASDEVYYRKIEYLSLLYLAGAISYQELNKKISKLFQGGFLSQLLLREISLDILTSREHLYAITHDIFYTSVFSRCTEIFDTVDRDKLAQIMEYSLLISIRRRDIDVLMELLCCVCILRLEILDYVWELSLQMIGNSQTDEGYFVYDDDREMTDIEKYFPKVYHPTLVAGILNKILNNNQIQLENEVEKKKSTVKSEMALKLLRNMNLDSIDLLYMQVKSGKPKYQLVLNRLSEYKEVFMVLILLELSRERFETVEKLLSICEQFDLDLELFHNRLSELT